MTTAILVTYVFEDKHLPLFRLHLERIRKHSGDDVRIYAAVNRLPQHLREEVAAQPDIKCIICDEVDADLRGREEHAACITALARRAAADGCDLFVTLHLDSFPVADGWIDQIRSHLERGHVLAVMVPHCYTACMAWTDAFFETGTPEFILSEQAKATETYARFQADYPAYNTFDSGLGYIVHAWQHDRTWAEIAPDSDHLFGGGMVFHLVAGIRFSSAKYVKVDPNSTAWRVRRMIGPIWDRLPPGLREKIRRPFANADYTTYFGSAAEKQTQLEALLSDPDSYIAAEFAKLDQATASN